MLPLIVSTLILKFNVNKNDGKITYYSAYRTFRWINHADTTELSACQTDRQTDGFSALYSRIILITLSTSLSSLHKFLIDINLVTGLLVDNLITNF